MQVLDGWLAGWLADWLVGLYKKMFWFWRAEPTFVQVLSGGWLAGVLGALKETYKAVKGPLRALKGPLWALRAP